MREKTLTKQKVHTADIRDMVCRLVLLIALVVSTPCAVAQNPNGGGKNVSTMTVKEALEEVKTRLDYSLWFNVEDVDLNKRVTVNFRGRTVQELLDTILKGQPLTYEISGKMIKIHRRGEGGQQKGNAATQTVSGTITDKADGQPLVGAQIKVKGSSHGTVTDVNGHYSLNVAVGDVLVCSYIGYETTSRIVSGSHSLNIKMAASDNTLDDVVVTGYQTIKKFNMTGAVNTIDSKTIDLRSSNSLYSILEGAVPGLTVYNDTYRIRGGASLNAGNDPLFIVDDFEVEQLPENMDMVESITVLKDAAATAIWGSRAANGVIVITTKKGRANDFRISYSGNMKVSSKPNYGDLHRASSADIVAYDRDAFYGGYYFQGYFDYSTNGYSLSQELLNSYMPESGDMNELSEEQTAEMNSKLAALGKLSNRKQIEDNLLRNAFEQHHMVSISGGSDKVNYYLAGSFIGSHSSYVGDSDKSFNINSRTSYKVLPFLTLRSDINATFSRQNNGYSSLASDIYSLYPYQMLLDDNGNRVMDYTHFNKAAAETMVNDYGYADEGKNLLDEIDLANNHTKDTDYKVRIGADFKIIDGLSLSADYQYEKMLSTTKEITSSKSFYGRHLVNSMAIPDDDGSLVYNIPQGDILDHQQATTDAWILKLGATLNRSFGADKKHYVNAVTGFELRSKHYYTESYRKLGYDDQTLQYEPIDEKELSDWHSWWNGDSKLYDATGYDTFGDVLNKEVSYFLSALYTYDNRYTASASLRIDQSNLFGVDDKYKRNPIYAFGANWNIKNERFFHCEPITTLLLRASFGLTGNFDRSGSTTPVMVASKRYYTSVNSYVTRLSTPPNPKLRWERTRSLNLSLDFGFMDRINGTLTYYTNKSYDLLGSTLIDPTNGYSEATINAADMKNHGLELQLGADIIRTKDFTWNVNYVLSYNKNKITHNNIEETTPYLNRVSGTTQFVEGYAREALWSYRWAGLDENGEPTIYDKEGNRLYDITTLDADDLVYSGTYQPKYSGSLSTGFRYKDFTANFLFTYNFGHVFRANYPTMNAYDTNPDMSDKIAERWQKPGDEEWTDVACLPTVENCWANTNYRENIIRYSSNTIRKGDMIRLREILLNYELPRRWLVHTPMTRCSLTMQFNNLWLWTKNKEGYDPEAIDPMTGKCSLSQPFSFTAGIKIDF